MNKAFTKRIFTPKTYFIELVFLGKNIFKILKIFTNKNTNNKLTEKILMVISVANDCKYCIWLDVNLAEKRGVTASEIQQLLNLNLDSEIPEQELNALIYAQHYAESNGKPNPIMTQNLFDFYGNNEAKKILLTIRAEMFGNLYFNTWKAFISRLKGKPAPNSNVIFELLFAICNSIIVIPFVLIKRLEKKKIKTVNI